MITYEFPLHEKVRAWLRFERLFNKFDLAINSQVTNCWEWQCFQVLINLVDISDRADLKGELLKELMRMQQYFEILKNHKEVDITTLHHMCDKTQKALDDLHEMPGRPGQKINSNHWFNLIYSRMGIPGGCNDFDAPSFHWWMNQPLEQKISDINSFYEIFRPIAQAIMLILFYIRNSADDTEQMVIDGSLTINANTKNVLVQINIPTENSYYPEISANRFQINVRLLAIEKPSWDVTKIKDSNKIIIRQCFSPMDNCYN